MWFCKNYLLALLIVLFFSELQANCCHENGTSLVCLLKADESESCGSLDGLENELNFLFSDVPLKVQQKLSFGSLADLTTQDIIKLPTNLIYFLPTNKLSVLSGAHLGSLLIAHEDDTPIAKKILQSVLTDQQRIEFLNFLVSKVIRNEIILDFIGETVYKWNHDVKDGKFQKLSNICGHALARLWAPYVLTRTKPISIRLWTLLTEAEQRQNHRVLCNKYSQFNWKKLPKSVRRLWSFFAVNQSYPISLNKWTVEQIDQYKFLLPDFTINELRLIPFDELSKMTLHNTDFDNSQARFIFSLLMENISTLKDVTIFYPTFFFKMSPLQINHFTPEEWADEKATILSFENTHLSYASAKQIFNKIASDWLSSKTNPINGWTSEDLRHLPLLYTQPATSFLKFCTSSPSIQSLIAVDSYMLTDRQAFYLSGCSSMLSFYQNDPKLLLGLKYMIKAVPVASIINIDSKNVNYQLASHLVSFVNNNNIPMALHLLNMTNPVKSSYFIEAMLKNKHDALFEQVAPLDVPGPIFDVLKHLYSNYTDRIDKLPKHILNVILESNELLSKWTGNKSVITKGLYNGYSCSFINKMNSAEFIVSISNYNVYLKRNGKVFPKNLQTCVAKSFINYLRLKSKITADLSTALYLEAWEVEAVQGFILTTFPIDVILNSTLRDNILNAIGRLSYPELMIASRPEKLSLLVDQYVTHILRNGTRLCYEHLYTLGNLIHFIPSAYLSLVDEKAFKLVIEAGLFDTRICVDSLSTNKWADLIVKAFGNVEDWSSDTLVSLSDLLILLTQDQLNSIPIMSRLNSADIIQTGYADEIEWLPNNIPFYKACKLFLGDEYARFTNSLSDLIDFHLTSMQNQLQMISPINYNQYFEEIIKTSEVKPKIVKPTVLIPVPELNNVFNVLSPSNLLNKFFAGNEKQNVNDTLSTKNIIQVITTKKIKDPANDKFSTSPSFLSSTLNSTNYYQNTKNVRGQFENPLDVIYMPLSGTTDNYNETLNELNMNNPANVKANYEFGKQLTIGDIKTGKKNIIKNHAYNITENDSVLYEFVEVSTIKHNTANINYNNNKKRSLELFFNASVQIGCEALKMLGPASVASMQFNSIIHSMSNEELENCVDLLGSFDINPKLAKHIWSKITDKTALHTYGSVLSGLSVDDIKTIDFDINSPWSLELINLFSKYVKVEYIRKEITKQFMMTMKSKANMPSHLWGSFGSLLCELQPRTFKIIMPNKELFWKTSSAFNTIKTCDTPCIKNLASVAVSIMGQANLWKTSEVERMGIIISGINITQWQLLLKFNPEALEGLTPSSVKCLDEQQIKLMNDSHMKYLTPKSAYELLKTHFKLLEFQSQQMLLKLVNFEIKGNLQPLHIVVLPKIVEGHKHIIDNNSKNDSIYAFESTNSVYLNDMQAISKASNHLSFSIFSLIVLFFIFK